MTQATSTDTDDIHIISDPVNLIDCFSLARAQLVIQEGTVAEWSRRRTSNVKSRVQYLPLKLEPGSRTSKSAFGPDRISVIHLKTIKRLMHQAFYFNAFQLHLNKAWTYATFESKKLFVFQLRSF